MKFDSKCGKQLQDAAYPSKPFILSRSLLDLSNLNAIILLNTLILPLFNASNKFPMNHVKLFFVYLLTIIGVILR